MKNLRLAAVVPFVADITKAALPIDPKFNGAPVPVIAVLLTVADHVPSPFETIRQS